MSEKAKKTAAELMAELGSDLEYRRSQAEREKAREETHAEYASLEAPILERLQAVGAEAESLPDLVARHAPLRPEIVQILLEALARASNERLQDAIVRALGAAQEPFPGDELMRLFDATSSDGLRWSIANTLAEARPAIDERWLIERLTNPRQGKAREMLALALARIAPPQTAIPVLRDLVKDLPGHVAMALAEVGGPAEADLLRDQLPAAKTWLRKEIEKAIRKIERRS